MSRKVTAAYGLAARSAPVSRNDFQLYRSYTTFDHSNFLGGCRRQIDDPVRPHPTIIDPDYDGAPVPKIDHANECAKRKRWMACSQCALVESLAARGGLAVKQIAVPGTEPHQQGTSTRTPVWPPRPR